ncbi:MAG: hypothetical protein BroJett042_16320 [Bacteroidota bacterium]|nr:MAG: hypothetical protein BroJett042_16320 [Bacteroidota bacterium]
MNKFCITLLLLSPLLGHGQQKLIPIHVSLFNESTAIPFTKFITTPIHPGLQAGTEFEYKQKTHSRFFQTANINYFYHNHLAQGVGLSSEFGYEYRLKSGLAFATLFGLGYLHTFSTAEEFTHTNGKYEQKFDKGNARLYPSLSFDIGYYLAKENVSSPKVFMRYQSWAEYPYSPGFIPIMTHINLHLGTKFFISRKRQQK